MKLEMANRLHRHYQKCYLFAFACTLLFIHLMGLWSHSQSQPWAPKEVYEDPVKVISSPGQVSNLPSPAVHPSSRPSHPPTRCPTKPSKVPSTPAPLDINYVETHLHTLPQTDPHLIQYARIRYVTRPSKLPFKLKGAGGKIPYNLAGAEDCNNYCRLVMEVFRNKTKGIFIEAGANDGVRGSNTLFLERRLKWTGLLIECNPTIKPFLTSHNRKAWTASVCLAPGAKAGNIKFSVPFDWTPSGTLGKPYKGLAKNTKWQNFTTETIPLFTLLAGIGLTEIDYFSLDVEGIELAVLKGFPFHKVIFKLLIVETAYYEKAQVQELDKLLKTNHYHYLCSFSLDKVYVHESVKDKLNLKRFSAKKA